MTAAARVERVEPYLAAHQVNALIEEKKSIEAALTAPAHIGNQIQDRGAMVKHLRAIEQQLHKDVPKPYAEVEIDRAVRREAELRERLTTEMPTQAEMRRNPPGAVDKERGFQRKYKGDILEWKNLRKRLHVSGQIDDHPDAREVSNLEKFRPSYSPRELNMDNAQIAGQQFYFPNGPIAIRNVMTDEEREAERRSRDEVVAQIAAEAAVRAYKAIEALKAEPAATSAPAGKGPAKN